MYVYTRATLRGGQETTLAGLLNKDFKNIPILINYEASDILVFDSDNSYTYTLENLDLFHSMEALFPQFFQIISIIFSYHGQHFHTMELNKTMEIGFSIIFLQYFQNTSVLWRRSNFGEVTYMCFEQ